MRGRFQDVKECILAPSEHDERRSGGTRAAKASAPSELRRTLSARHLTMIAVGGSIGTGLFVASGATIATAGPGGALLGYVLIGRASCRERVCSTV